MVSITREPSATFLCPESNFNVLFIEIVANIKLTQDVSIQIGWDKHVCPQERSMIVETTR